MLCLEVWYYTALIIMVGCLKNPEIQVDAISICFNYQLWALMISLGFSAAVSVWISNELGAGHPQAAKFSIVVAVLTSLFIGILFSAMVVALRTRLPRLFTDVPIVVKETSKLAYLLAATVILNSVQPVLSGVVIDGGWQALVAFVNIDPCMATKKAALIKAIMAVRDKGAGRYSSVEACIAMERRSSNYLITTLILISKPSMP